MTENPTATDAVAVWAAAQVTALGVTDWPAYGSPAWRALLATDPRRAAAIIEAAEQWRQHRADVDDLDQLLTNNPEEWYRRVTADADAEARRIAPALAKRPTAAEMRARARRQPPRPVTATPGWPPVAIPGRPGWHRRLVDGRQVDLPTARNKMERTA
ncbi:DUF2742 domain-containing protein [Streptomyces mutabilis]|uniref:DUF2742 domain-containing protein n=1 Tax=Streptomyces mutabilis TaxID=67332 RepID=UPI0022BA2FC3|nr:DUF2742 domain-containing protein [Streptomyces mutabilis]MCZ9353214.1 DUF2742 domain-containing protein [Streptomyces mutabilis]